MTPTPPPVQRLAPDVVLLTGPAVAAVRYAIRVTVAARLRNGYPPHRGLTDVAAALAEPGTADPEPVAPQHDSHELIDVQEAARMLGCSHRQARRLAPSLGGRLQAGRWLLERTAVTEHLEGRHGNS